MNCPDINYYFSKLRQENIISEFVESGKQEFAASFSSNIDDSKYSKGSKFVSLKASIILQDETKTEKSELRLITKTANQLFLHLQSTSRNFYIFFKI